MNEKAIVDVMRRVYDHQQKVQTRDEATPRSDMNFEWVRGVFYTGVMGAYAVTRDEKYLDGALDYSEKRGWKLDKPDTRHADWQCVGQLYLELYLLHRDPVRIQAIRENIDAQMADPRPGREDWWWCDALYMAPPVLARLYAATDESRYLDFLDVMFRDAYDFLYDPGEQLFFRDRNYFEARTANGQKVFWSRGNGWVIAGLARVIPFLPKPSDLRKFLVGLFRDMAGRIAFLQGADGLWRTSLLDSEEFPDGETSGTALFVFALAWGINSGILDRAAFLPTVEKGWDALAGCVTENGKLGHVQVVAAAPGPVNPDDTREYAAGALLLAGGELIRANAAQ